jgi:hypothetical protein
MMYELIVAFDEAAMSGCGAHRQVLKGYALEYWCEDDARTNARRISEIPTVKNVVIMVPVMVAAYQNGKAVK